MAGVGNPFENSCILTAIGVVAIIVCILFIAPHGSRRLFLTLGLVICGCCQLIVAVVYTKYPGTETTGKVIVGLSVLYIAGYNVMSQSKSVNPSLTNLSGNDRFFRMACRW